MFKKPIVFDRLRVVGARLGINFDRLTLCAIRSAGLSPDGAFIRSMPGEPDRYDDLLCTIQGPACDAFAASVDPGRHAVETREGGAARLEPGVYLYTVGTHPDFVEGKRQQFPALNQKSAVTIRRDENRNYAGDSSERTQTGVFLISVHWGFGDLSRVGRSSAGCIVLQSHRTGPTGEPWQRFWQSVKKSGQRDFSLWVLTNSERNEVLR